MAGHLEKMEIDYSSMVDSALPTIRDNAKTGDLLDALEKLNGLEKQTRSAADAVSTGRILECIVELCINKNDWARLNENLVLYSKKRGQLKQAVTKMVQAACEGVNKTPDKPTKLELIDTLRTVTAGKIYVEVERAHLTKQLAEIREAEGNIEEAASILQELQVETYGSMDKKEKAEFILEQMRLCIAKTDYIRTQIISKKITTKFFLEPDTAALKLKYYKLMIELDAHDGDYLSISKHYRHVYDTAEIQACEEEKLKALKCVVVYLLLAPYDNEQSDLMHKLKELRDMESVPEYLALLQIFTTKELLRWSDFTGQYQAILKADTNVFTEGELGAKRWEHFNDRVVEHNIRVIAAYYTKIRLTKCTELLSLPLEKVEEFLSKMVVSKAITAKIDRLDGVVTFACEKSATDVLNNWSYNLNKLMSLINNTTHLINKEKMIHEM